MGCQMNKLDSELVENELRNLGYEQAGQADEADVIIFNTCSVRQHAEEKVISKIGQLRKRHQREKNLVLAVIGCMAQRLGQDMLDNYQQVDIVCGPGQLHRLGDFIERVRQNRTLNRLTALNDPAENESLDQLDADRSPAGRQKQSQAYVRIMRGCDNFCSYCIVPYVRGREVSRPLSHIHDEVRRLVDAGVLEITLLGQAVNKYRYTANGSTLGLAEVLEDLDKIEGLKRLRFVTSYPHDFDRQILEAMRDLRSVCSYLHICAQSGSDRILKAMNRHYTADEYLELIQTARETVPGFAVAGDFIVGFPGETEDDFLATAALMEKVRYKNCFIFKYSPRPGTKADERLPDDVPLEVKQERNQRLLDLQNRISREDNQTFIGTRVQILVEGYSKSPQLNASAHEDTVQLPQLTGRTSGDHIVVFNADPKLIGQLIDIRIFKASGLTLFGETP